MNVLIIPARWGSTRFPGKLLHVVAGKPVLELVWRRCSRATKIDRTIIATDDMRIAEAAFDWGAEIALTSRQHQSGTDRVAEVVKRAPQFSLIVNVQGDEPLIDPALIDRIVTMLQRDRETRMVTAAHPFGRSSDANSPHQVKAVLDRRNRALYFSRSIIPYSREHNAAVRFLRHQGVYGFRRETLLRFVRWKPGPLEKAESLEQLRALENGVRVHVLVTKQGSPGIDTPEDAAALEQIIARAAKRNRHR